MQVFTKYYFRCTSSICWVFIRAFDSVKLLELRSLSSSGNIRRPALDQSELHTVSPTPILIEWNTVKDRTLLFDASHDNTKDSQLLDMLINCPCLSFRLKVWLWDKITKAYITLVSQQISLLRLKDKLYIVKEILSPNFVFIELDRIDRIRQIDICCHCYKFTITTNISTTSISINVSLYLVLTW